MKFSQFLENSFIGQDHVINQLEILGNEIISGSSINIVLAARSGFGKTTLGNAFVKWVEPKYTQNSFYYLGDVEQIYGSRRFHILDEAHLIQNPEFIYPLMDSNKFIFIILTNEYYELKEPFYNRCHEFTFSEYSTEELIIICRNVFLGKRLNLPYEYIRYIVEYLGRGMPRKLKQISKRLSFYFIQTYIPKSFSLFKKRVDDFLNIKNGLTLLDTQYVEFLKNKGNKRASLLLIVNGTKIPKSLILEEIEPYLISKNILEITSKGRQYIGE